MSHVITDTPFTPKGGVDWNICEHCGEQVGMHYQYADGRIVCVKFTDENSAGSIT